MATNLSLRGSEASIRITVEGQLLKGSFFQVKDFRAAARQDLPEADYVGDLASRIDFVHNGFDLSFSIDMEDRAPLDLLTQIVQAYKDRARPPRVNITVFYRFRKEGAAKLIELYPEVILKEVEGSIGGRKDYITRSYEGKCEDRKVLTQ